MSWASTLLHPERSHGHERRPPFFEGWYYKLVDAAGEARFAVIPGVFLHDDPSQAHAFVQFLDGATGEASYHREPVDAFRAARRSLHVVVGRNRFTDRRIDLDLAGDGRTVRGSVELGWLRPWPVRPWSPGIMGPYAFVPWMECNHGVVSFDHPLTGGLTVDGRDVDLTGGRGYLEKDWGAAFPAGYVWLQSNHFETVGTSLVGSIAIIPWRGSAFPGFLVGLWHEGRLHRFATYTGARTEHLTITDDHVEWTVVDRRHRLRLQAQRAEGGLLHAPTRESMGSRVGETMLATVRAELTADDGRTVFAGEGRHAGLELHGDLERLLAMQV